MEDKYEKVYHDLEEKHWWFRNRRNFAFHLLKKYSTNKNINILEIGCSGGPFILQLINEGYINIKGIDISENGVELAKQRGIKDVSVMDAQNLDFKDNSFDLIVASDVLEHLANENKAASEWNRVLKPGGIAIVFVPAFENLWSEHDIVNHHYKRYTKETLKRTFTINNFEVLRLSYWNSILFLPTFTYRKITKKAIKANPEELKQMGYTSEDKGDLNFNKTTNFIFSKILSFENFFHKNWNIPFGISTYGIFKKKN
jgi:ubiquinone/menaquinone biosynthesis C-methylase UbiE